MADSNMKIHEIMISSEETPRIKEENDCFYMLSKNVYNLVKFNNNEYSSRDVCHSKEDLKNTLDKHDFFKPSL